MSKKSTTAELQKRVNKVFDLLVNGATREQIFQYASEKAGWDVTERQLDNYIAKANERIIEIGQTHKEVELGRSLARLHNLYFLSMTFQNHSVCLGIVKEINKMLGLITTKTEITTANGQSIQPDATQIAQEILRVKALEKE